MKNLFNLMICMAFSAPLFAGEHGIMTHWDAGLDSIESKIQKGSGEYGFTVVRGNKTIYGPEVFDRPVPISEFIRLVKGDELEIHKAGDKIWHYIVSDATPKQFGLVIEKTGRGTIVPNPHGIVLE